MIYWNQVELDYEPRRKILPQIDKVLDEPEMIEDESAFLCGILKQRKPKRVMEVGIAGGGTTAILLQCLHDLDYECEVFSIDYMERFYRDGNYTSGFLGKQALDIIKPAKITHKFLYGEVACEWCERLNLKDIDCLILDTTHVMPGEVLEFISILPYLSDNAMVVMHDTSYHLSSKNKFGYATSILFSSVTADKYVNYDFEKKLYYPNISAFSIGEVTRQNIDQVFLALMTTWKTIPDDRQISSYRNSIKKAYGEEYREWFDIIEDIQKASILSWDYSYRLPFQSFARNERIALYGAGKVGQEFMRQVSQTGWPQISCWVDKKYGEKPWYKIDSPETLKEHEYDRIVIAVKDPYIAGKIKDELKKYCDEDKIFWGLS